MQAGAPSYLIWVAVGIAILARFGMRELRDRELRVSRLFLVPGIIGIVAAGLIGFAAIDAPRDVIVLVGATLVALAVGCGIGLAVARFTTVRAAEDSRFVIVRGSYATLAIWIAALGLRGLARFAVGTHDVAIALVANAALLALLAAAIGVLRYRIFTAGRNAHAASTQLLAG